MDKTLPESYQNQPKKSEAVIDLPDHLPGINITTGLSRVGGNKKLYRDLLVKFHRDNQDITHQITKALEQEDSELAQRLAHTIKGVSGNIGASEIQKMAEIVELNIKDEKLDNISNQIEAINQVLQLVLKGLEDLVKLVEKENTKSGNKRAGDINQLVTNLKELEPLLKKRKPKPSKEIIEQINQFEWQADITSLLKKMTQQITKYKFKDAGITLEKLIEQL